MTDSKAEARTVLLVEDEEAHAVLVRRQFKSSEWKIHHVASLEDAFIWLAENEPPSIVISDYLLPDGTGLDLAKGAKSPEEVGFPLIILTAHGSEQIAGRSLKSGIMAYVVKSAEEFRELPRTAERVLREWENISNT